MSDFTLERPKVPGKYKYRCKKRGKKDESMVIFYEDGELMADFYKGMPLKLSDIPFGGFWKKETPKFEFWKEKPDEL